MEDQEVTTMACIDLSAAFDTVDHGMLEKVLRVKFGITGKALSWFSSYLRPRDFMVNVGEAYSSKKKVFLSQFLKEVVLGRFYTRPTRAQ